MTLVLSTRPGIRPATHYALPHQQLDQTPPPAVYKALLELFIAIPGTVIAAAFLRGREFAHLHPPQDGSFHMILPRAECDAVLATGWGELHPLAASGKFKPTALMIYAPRDEVEIETVLAITLAAQRFAMTPSEVA